MIGATSQRSGQRGIHLPLAIALVLFAWLAIDNHHYWHEARFLFATTNFTNDAIFDGVFNPHQVGNEIDELESGGFYSAKFLHIVYLDALFQIVEPAEGGWGVAVGLSFLLILLSGWLIAGTVSLVGAGDVGRLPIFILFLCLPVTAYLAGKLLSEVTALVFVAAGFSTLFLAKYPGRTKFLIAVLATALCIALTASSRLDMVICFPAFLLGWLASCPQPELKGRIAKAAALSLVLAVPLYLAAITLFGIELPAVAHYFGDFIELQPKSLPMSALGVASFGGAMYLLAMFSLRGFGRTEKFAAIWFGLTFFPMLVLSANYVVEPRYLTASVLPLLALAAAALTKIPTGRMPTALLAMVATIAVLLGNKLVLLTMPYELDRSALAATISEIERTEEDPVILIPWSYTDFNWLSVMMPDRNIFNVHAPAGDGTNLSPEWRLRLQAWYGHRWLEGPSGLDQLLANGKTAHYIGWRWYPPAENLAAMGRRIRVTSIPKIIENLGLQDHREESWLWGTDLLEDQPSIRTGQYEAYLTTASR